MSKEKKGVSDARTIGHPKRTNPFMTKTILTYVCAKTIAFLRRKVEA